MLHCVCSLYVLIVVLFVCLLVNLTIIIIIRKNILSWFSVYFIIDIYIAKYPGRYLSEDVGSTSFCVASRATEELTAFIEDHSYIYGGMFIIMD